MRRRPPTLEIIERLDALPTREQRAALARIERQAAERRAILLTSETRLDAQLNPWRLRGEVREFGLADLALTEPDIAAFLGPEAARSVTARARHALLERTEGWIGAWNILRPLIGAGDAPADLVRTFSGRDRDLAAYFETSILPRLYSEGGDTDRSVEILRRYADDLITGRGEAQSVRQLIASLPVDSARLSSLSAELALGSIFSGDFAGAATLIDRIAEQATRLSDEGRPTGSHMASPKAPPNC